MTKRLRDNRIGRFDARKSGYVFYNNETNGFSDSGRWEVKHDGAICFAQWRSPANFDLCMPLYRSGAGVIEAAYGPDKPADEHVVSSR